MKYHYEESEANRIIMARTAGLNAGLKRSTRPPDQWISKNNLFMLAWQTGFADGLEALECEKRYERRNGGGNG